VNHGLDERAAEREQRERRREVADEHVLEHVHRQPLLGSLVEADRGDGCERDRDDEEDGVRRARVVQAAACAQPPEPPREQPERDRRRGQRC
jgi:hypothetical protein